MLRFFNARVFVQILRTEKSLLFAIFFHCIVAGCAALGCYLKEKPVPDF